MPKRLVVCTGNVGKLAELRRLLPSTIELLTPGDVGIAGELPETGRTLEANASQKATHVHGLCGMACLADDSGLEVEALHGAPGVDSAHYAGPSRDPAANIGRLLQALEGRSDRSARFRTVLALVLTDGEVRLFEGSVEGVITEAPRGTGGFGYDPVFMPLGGTRTFGEMTLDEKNRGSHRARAVEALADHFQVL